MTVLSLLVVMCASCIGTENRDTVTRAIPAESVVEQRWARSGHVLEPPDPGFQPAISARQAVDEAANDQQVLKIRLGLFTNKSYGYIGKRTIVDVPAWVVTVRQCVPRHGPPRTGRGCASDHLHVVVNADNGRYMQAFAP